MSSKMMSSSSSNHQQQRPTMALRKQSLCLALLLLMAGVPESRSFTFQQGTNPMFSSQQRIRRLPLTTQKTDDSLHLYSSVFHSEVDGQQPQQRTANQMNNRHSANDWLYNMKSLPKSSVLREIKGPVRAVFGWATVVSLVHQLLLRSRFAALASKLCVSGVAHSFLVSSLGLLLVFRTNSAYQRFYEGRKIWENILSVSRNLSRLIQLYARDIGPDRKHRLRNLIAAYPYLLRHHIRRGCLCEGDSVDKRHRLLLEDPSVELVETRFEGDKSGGGTTDPELSHDAPKRECWVDRRNLPWSLFTPGALEKVARTRNRPLWVCDRMGKEICDIPYGPNYSNRERQHFLSQVEKLTNAIGQCERIHQTAVPLNYARHSLRSLTIWLFTLPFAMVKDLGWATAPATAVIAWLMFGVYQIGYSIEDPFQGSLRLSILCDAIRTDVMGLDDDEDNDYDESRDTAYSMEISSWVSDAAMDRLAPQPIPQAVLDNVTRASNSRLFTMAEYEAVQP